MAKENNEIGDIVKKCKILLLDIEGTTTSISFVKDKLFPYAEDNVKGFLESHWESEEVKEAVAALRKQATEDQAKSVEGLVAVPSEDASKDEQIDGLVKNVKWQMWADRKVGPLKQLQGLIWKLGYDKGDIKGLVYDDVPPALELWRATEGQKVYIYSSGSVQAQKLLFSKSIAGDLLPLIEGHFDTAVGAKQEPASYAAIVDKIGCKAEEILFLTDIVKEAEAARASGLHAALVSREGNAALPEAPAFPVLHSFEQLAHTNKRKPDPQAEEEVPAKVPKTDTKDNVKTTSETEAGTAKANGTAETAAMETAAVVEKSKDPETMEVEETPDSVVETKEAQIKAVEETATTDIADITEKDVPMDEAVTVPVVAKPIVPVETIAKADSTDNAEAKINTTDNASNAPAKQASAFEVMDVKAPSSENDKTKNTVEPKVEKSKVDESPAKTKDEPEAKVVMVDATTLTDPDAVLPNKISIAVQTPRPEVLANEPASVDAVIEPAALEVPAAKTPIEEPKKAETPVVETTAEVAAAAKETVEMSVKDAIVAAAAETKDEANKALASSTQNVEATSTAEVEESSKMEAATADSTTVDSPTTDVKIEKSSTTESQSVKVIAEETSEASPKEAKSTEANATLDSNGSGSSEAAEAPSEGVSIIVETDPLQNGVEKAADKPEEMDVQAVIEEVTNQKDSNAVPEREIQQAVEKIAEKTEPKETEKMETEVTESEEKVETVMEPKKPAEIIPKESAEKTPKEHAEKLPKETTKEANLSTIEINDITDDKESLDEVTDIIDDIVPIVEEPSHLEEMEELQNAGDVLEKECDEILSKVQDVTSLDYIPLKTLHTISEEMETDNTDTNDIVERILDTEMELSIKPEDIDLNTVQEIAEPKTDTDERIGQIKPATVKPSETPKVEDVTEDKMEVSGDTEMVVEKPNDNKVVPEIENGAGKAATVEPIVEKMETEVVEPEVKIESEKKVAEESAKPQEIKSDTEVSIAAEAPVKTDETEAKPENKESDKASVAVVQELKETSGSQDAKMDPATETKVNGNSNGNVMKLNGNASKDDDLKSRLTAETVKEKVNGSNGDSVDAEIGQGDIKVDAEIADIKVKTVTDEAHTPKEQPVEA